MTFGIQRKILLVFIAALTLTTGFTVLLAAYLTNRHNQQTIVADLERDLLTWHDDLQAMTQRLREVALTSVRDAATSNQLTEFAQGKSGSLDRLHLVLHAGGFSSIAVYTGGQLSHYVSASEAGMTILPSSNEAAPDVTSIPPPPHLDRPSVSLNLQAPHGAQIEIAIPVRSPTQPPASTVAVVVFHKEIDRAALELVARKTGKVPALYSIDGKHRQQLTGFARTAETWDVPAAQAAIAGHVIERTVTTNQGSFYQGLLSWEIDGKPEAILGLASPRANTLQAVGQTGVAMLGVASLVLIFGIAFGWFWISRIIEPIASTGITRHMHIPSRFENEPVAGDNHPAEQPATEPSPTETERLVISRSEFLAQMGHELRTPLNAILGYAQILRQDAQLTGRHARGVAMIEESGQRLLSLINDIVDISRISASKLELHPVDTNLAVSLRAVCDIVRAKAEEKCLEFSYQGAPDLPAAVCIDDQRLRQVLLNLLGNAVKSTHSGRIQLRVTKLTEPAEHKGIAMARLLFEVEDSGVGMTPQQLETVFPPLDQVMDATRSPGDAGLGLAISRHLVRLMGGEIYARSELGQGTIFRFELSAPVAASELATVQESTTLDQEEIVIPPLAEMETLYKLALAGSMRDIRERANHLENTDPRYSAFARRVRSLAQAYQSQAILALVARYRAQAALIEGSAVLATSTQSSSDQ